VNLTQSVWVSPTLKCCRKRKFSCVVARWLIFTAYVLATVSLPYPSRHNPRAPQSFHLWYVIPSLVRHSMFGTSFHLFPRSPLRRRIFPSLPLLQKNVSGVTGIAYTPTVYKLIVFIALKNPLLVDYLMFMICMVATDIDPNLMVIQIFLL